MLVGLGLFLVDVNRGSIISDLKQENSELKDEICKNRALNLFSILINHNLMKELDDAYEQIKLLEEELYYSKKRTELARDCIDSIGKELGIEIDENRWVSDERKKRIIIKQIRAEYPQSLDTKERMLQILAKTLSRELEEKRNVDEIIEKYNHYLHYENNVATQTDENSPLQNKVETESDLDKVNTLTRGKVIFRGEGVYNEGGLQSKIIN